MPLQHGACLGVHSLGVAESYLGLQRVRSLATCHPGLLSLLLRPIAAPALFIPNPSMRYVSVAVDWLLDVTPLL
jgi:hypothetical protein